MAPDSPETPKRVIKKGTKSRDGCLRCKDKRRKCDEAKPECKECTRRNLPCPGYQKEIKWSLRHERLLRREQPKSAVRRITSPATILFDECVNAIQQDSAGQTSMPQKQPEGTASEAYLVDPTVSHETMDENTLRELLSRSGEAFGEMPWIQQDQTTMLLSIEDSHSFDMGAVHEAQDEENETEPVPPLDDLESYNTNTAADTSYALVQTGIGTTQDYVNEGDNNEHDAVQESLRIWKKQMANAPSLNKSLIDVTTFLIDHWFRDVCPMWSAYDSNLNPNRILMSQMWTNSKAVLYSMKTMAATCLIPTLPHLKSEATSSARSAVEAIGEDLERLQLSTKRSKVTVPLDLFLALLCVGTTMCWLDTNLLGLAYWKEARRLRDHYHNMYWLLDEQEQQKLMFFENSCVYWDMLASVVSNESPEPSIGEDTILGCSMPSELITPHPWTGVSYKQQRLLSRTISLCRRHRIRVRELAKAGHRNAEPAPEDLMDAYMISDELETMEIPQAQSIVDTGDRTSLQIHFAQLANAFRIASMLQLHQTFRFEASPYLQTESQKRFVLKLALELIKILEEIPVWSNTRCTQPILYITAASGLRFESPPSQEVFPVLTPEVLEVHRARKFILDRFAALQRSLPPKPIVVATELVQAVWRKYERESRDVLNVHWIDVMIDAKLSTLFG